MMVIIKPDPPRHDNTVLIGQRQMPPTWTFALDDEGQKGREGLRSHLEHRDVVLPVDLVGGRVEPAALLHVLVEDAAALHVAEAELAQVELRQPGGRPQQEGVKRSSVAIGRK